MPASYAYITVLVVSPYEPQYIKEMFYWTHEVHCYVKRIALEIRYPPLLLTFLGGWELDGGFLSNISNFFRFQWVKLILTDHPLLSCITETAQRLDWFMLVDLQNSFFLMSPSHQILSKYTFIYFLHSNSKSWPLSRNTGIFKMYANRLLSCGCQWHYDSTMPR